MNRVSISGTDCCALFQYLWQFLQFYHFLWEKKNYSIPFSNVPRLQSFLLDNSDILRIYNVNHLDSHDLSAGFVHHLVDGSVRSSPDLPQVLEVLGREVTMLLWRNLQLPWGLDAVRPQPLSETHESMLLHTETTAQTHGTAKVMTVAKQVSRMLPICNWSINSLSRPQTRAIGWLECQDTNSRVWASFYKLLTDFSAYLT